MFPVENGQAIILFVVKLATNLSEQSVGLINTRDGDVIFFIVCVCLSLRVFVCHDVCPDSLIMDDWCHTNNILQERRWRYLVVQVICISLMTSLMTLPGYKLGQILKMS